MKFLNFAASTESRLPNAILSLYYATAFDVVFKFSCGTCLFRIAISTPVTRIYNVAAVMAGDAFRQKSSVRQFPPNYENRLPSQRNFSRPCPGLHLSSSAVAKAFEEG